MSDRLDDFVQQMQQDIDSSVQQDWGDAIYSRWKNPLFMGALENPSAAAQLRGSCGDSMEMYLEFEEGKIVRAGFMTDGCGPSVVCGSYVAELAHGRTPEELLDITGEQILELLGGLPEEHTHCAHLAVAALREAVDDYMSRQASGASSP